MGCCLTKRSRSRNKGLNETLLSGEGASDEEVRMNPARGNRNGYTPVLSPEVSRIDSVGSNTGVSLVSPNFRTNSLVCIDGLDTARQTPVVKTRKVVGTSLLVLPSIKSLKKAGWLLKRGHMVRDCPTELLIFFLVQRQHNAFNFYCATHSPLIIVYYHLNISFPTLGPQLEKALHFAE